MLIPVATAAFPKDPTGSVIVNWSLAAPKKLKRIHLIRHGQAEHNVAALSNPNAYKDEKYFDCSLTEFGEEQATTLGDKLKGQPPEGFPVELVVTSPLKRTLQTATTIFETYARGNSDAGSPAPMIAHELCREGLHVHQCDRRRPISVHKEAFPHVDFSEISSNEDALWQPASETRKRETPQEIAARVTEFMQWLMQRPESSIAVVSHSGFLRHLLLTSSGSPHFPVANQKDTYFDNCELRSFVLLS